MEAKEIWALLEDRGIELTTREKELLTLRYGLEDGQERSLEETAEIMGITRERVRQIEHKIFRRPVHLRRAKEIKDFYK